MSDSHSPDESARRGNTRPSNGLPSALRWFFVINGLICCVLIGAWVALGMRGGRNSDSNDLEPFARGADTIEEEDDNNGRPKVVKSEMKWSADGIADFEMTERSGRIIRNEDLLGHPWVVSFIFTNCAGPCAKVSSAMRRLQNEFFVDTDLRLVTITVVAIKRIVTQVAHRNM